MNNEKKVDKKAEAYFRLLRKIERLFDVILGDRISKDDKQSVELCLTETYFFAKDLIRLIDKISETNLDYTEKDLDDLSSYLIYAKIDIYDEMVDWFKELEKPLNIAIDKIGDIGAERYGWE